MPRQRTSLIKDIHSLLAQEPGLTPLAQVEDVLTEGYAHALSLEARQLRLERHVWRVAVERPGACGTATQTEELTEQLRDVQCELSHLRNVLVTLRDRARELRAAKPLAAAG